MELKELITLVIGLGVSGLITYKTFQWAIYEEIGVGLASLFLGFAILLFLAISNYEVIRRWRLLEQAEVSTVTEQINEATASSIELINVQLEKQKELTDAVTQGLKQVALATSNSNDEAIKMAQRAIEIAKEAKEQSERHGSIQAWATWDSLMAEFLEVERYLHRWEEKNGFRRDTPAAESISELERRLEALGEIINLPATIKALYLKRGKKHEILMKLKEIVEPYADQYVQLDLSLPAPPKLPSGTSSNSDTDSRNE